MCRKYSIVLVTEEIIVHCDMGAAYVWESIRIYDHEMMLIKEGYLAHIQLSEVYKKIEQGEVVCLYKNSAILEDHISTYPHYELMLQTKDFVFYADRTESDENGCMLMFDSEYNLRSDNYFAYNAWLEEMIEIKKGTLIPIFIHEDSLKNLDDIVGDLVD